MRLLVEIATALRQALGDEVVLFTRVSATDWTDGGVTCDETVVVARALREAGVDLIDVSSGGNVPTAAIPVGPGYQVPLARQIRQEAEVLVNAVGVITSGVQAEAILQAGDADAVMVARAFLRNPRWALFAAEELGEVIEWPEQIARARTVTK